MEKKNFKWKNIIKYGIGIMIVVIIIIITTIIYLGTLKNAIKNNTISEIKAITHHDQYALKNYVEYNWSNLKRVSVRMRRVNYDSLEEFQTLLAYERNETSFLGVYYVDTDYTIYTADYVIPNEYYDKELVKEIINGQSKCVKRFLFEKPKFTRCIGNRLVYGMSLEYCFKDEVDKSPLRLGDTEFIAVLGITEIDSLQNGLILDSFEIDGVINGYSAVVNLEGQYIVDPYGSNDEDTINRNFFTDLSESVKCSLTAEEVREKMSSWENFTFTRTERVFNENTGKYYNRGSFYSCIPINDQDPIRWYFLFSVSDVVFQRRSNFLMVLNILELLVVAVIVLIAFVIVIINYYKAANAIVREKATSEFLSNISHEIRTPLNGLVGLNYLMVDAIGNPEKRKEVKEWLRKSQGTTKYLLSLVNDILDMSKLQAGKVDIVYEPFLIESIVDAVWSMQRDNMMLRDIQFIPDINIIEPCIKGDAMRLKQVLVNIVSNAVKFTSAGGKITVSVNQTYLDKGRVLTSISCEDTGCGMSPEFLKTIFDAFTQERNKITSSVKGTGLGMAISKSLVDAMGGELLVESELGKGSKFTINIPAEISSIPNYLTQQSMDASSQISRGKQDKPIKILVAEDNELNAEVVLEMLRINGFVADRAENGKKAVEMFSESKTGEYDVILMDMRMPVMDGVAACKAIRALDREDAKTVLIYACTANTFKEDKILALECGMNDFLTKPIDIKALLQMLEKTMDKQKK